MTVRIIQAVITALCLVSPTLSTAQTIDVHGSGGPTLYDRGSSVAAGVGFSPRSWLTIAADVERTHLETRLTTDGRGVTSAFRGGTLTVVAASVRASLFGSDRIDPYVLAGMAAGVSRPNVNDLWPDRVANQVAGPFAGGGVQIPLGDHVSLFADARVMLMVGTEADELLGVSPVRAGVTWRF